MKIKILSVGKIKEPFMREAIAEYSKRLSKYCTLEICEVDDEKTPDNAGEKANERIRAAEAERLKKLIPDDAYVVALAIGGREYTSVEFADGIDRLGIDGVSQIVFIIGGSIGLSEEILENADERMSFSRLTFPHQLMRVILLEQIYRAFRIIKGEPYHK
ncbi:MAG: 23S rRNA (pseudouridine(1915)-N(3))-methyltransferase RlmH [Eubacterium sp.]|nr:23S rRNA (pseudouridine(1915)-N(3))-methyltransferase RlmH [Eubacterium sp.]